MNTKLNKVELSMPSEWQTMICPTDTVWGLIAKFNKENQEKIYQIKNRNRDKPLIVFAKSIEDIKPLVKDWTDFIDSIAKQYWSGELTIILERSEQCPQWLNPGFDFIGFRIPNHPIIQSILEQEPLLLSTSANLSGDEPVLNYQEALKFQEQVDHITEAPDNSEIASTIIQIINDKITILRAGNIKFS